MSSHCQLTPRAVRCTGKQAGRAGEEAAPGLVNGSPARQTEPGFWSWNSRRAGLVTRSALAPSGSFIPVSLAREPSLLLANAWTLEEHLVTFSHQAMDCVERPRVAEIWRGCLFSSCIQAVQGHSLRHLTPPPSGPPPPREHPRHLLCPLGPSPQPPR